MDTTAPDIVFDDQGNCNFCNDYLNLAGGNKPLPKQGGLDSLLDAIRQTGRGKEYDCIVGLSGGVDSSYVLYLAVKHGLRPLAVHLDNGWNSELAVHNISNLVRRLNVDLYTHVIDWEENRDMQLSFFKANVIDIELLMDNAMLATNYQLARRYGLKYILSGSNHATEGMRMPRGWNWMKFDARNIRSIHRRFGTLPINAHPLISVPGYIYNEFMLGIKWLPFLDYFDYRKDDAIVLLVREIGYKPYPYKHYESVFTRFYQGYILPRKFGVDKRKLHLSTLIMSDQMSRETALAILESPPYHDERQMMEDKAFVIKKLGFTDESFERYMAAPAAPHDVYGSERAIWDFLKKIHKNYRKVLG